MGLGLEKIEAIDALIRTGQLPEARRQLRKITEIPLLSKERLPLARLARRANLPFVAQRVLEPTLRSADPEISVEYSASLLSIGATTEAERRLRAVDPQVFPKALLYLAFQRIQHWEYEDASQLLLNYLQRATGYSRRVAQVNLLACLVMTGQWSRIDSLAQELRSACQARDERLLLFNLALLQAESAYFQGALKDAAALLASEDLENWISHERQITGDALLLEKWRTIVALAAEPESPTLRDRLTTLKVRANKLFEWETVRDCDFHLGLLTHDSLLLDRVIIGTPYPAYQVRVRRWASSNNISLRGFYEMNMGIPSETPGGVLDVAQSLFESRPFAPRGGLVHRSVGALFSDLYRPARTAYLHATLFTGERYNAESSPNQIYQVLSRTRRAFSRSKIPLRIAGKTGWFQLVADRPLMVRLEVTPPASLSIPPRAIHDAVMIQKNLGVRDFTAGEVATLLKCSTRTAQSRLRQLVETRLITSHGQGSLVRYRWAPS